MKELRAADGLVLRDAGEESLRIGFSEPDWLGPIARPAGRVEVFGGADPHGRWEGMRFEAAEGAPRLCVRAYADRPLLVFRIEARRSLSGLATGKFATPGVVWPGFRPDRRAAGGIPEGTASYGHQYTEFALPVQGDASCLGYTFAGHRPPVVFPLLFVAPDLRTLLLAPLEGFHEQVIVVPKDASEADLGVRCGWHGDLDSVPEGFVTELAVVAASRPRAALDALGEMLLRRHGTRRPSRYADDGVGRLSYWTDNGSVYYYRTEPGEDYATTLERTIAELRAARVPVCSVQLDSWFYPHETLRPVSDEGAPVVPPTGMLRWEPREDLFPNGFEGLRERLGGLPLTFHSRHFSANSPYFDAASAWRDAAYAHPVEPRLLDRLLEQAASWGAITYEQDWLVESFLGVRGLREAPGRARAWQEGMDRSARSRGLTLQWCMATPADFLQTVGLEQVTSIRTSGDYRYLFENGLNWVWFLHGNAFARALGLHPYKDVFVSHGETGLGPGERYAEAESLLAALSAGPVGIGDRRGHTDRDLVLRTCRDDGVLLKPDAPIAAIDRCFRRNAFLEATPLVGETESAHPAGRWVYVLAMNASRAKVALRESIPLADLGAAAPSGPVVAYDWRTRRFAKLDPSGALEIDLGWQEFSYTVLCPVFEGGLALFGDPTKYVTCADRRLGGIEKTPDGLRFDVLGSPGEEIRIEGCAARPPAFRVRAPDDSLAARRLDEGGGRFAIVVRLGRAGRAEVELDVRTESA